MKKYWLLVACLILVLTAGAAGAADKTYLGTPKGLSDANFKSDNFAVNDMSLTAWDKGEGVTEVMFKYTLTRYARTFKRFNIMLTGLNQSGSPLWSMSAKPDIRNLAANRPWQAKETVYVPVGAFRNAARVWMRIVDN